MSERQEFAYFRRLPVTFRRGREIHAIAHKLDDPAAFHAAIARLSRRDGH